MKWDQTTPCASCPYRKDVPAGIWDAYEFEKLLEQDKNPFGATFLCHLSNGMRPADARMCAGWVADQKRRGVPNMQLRLKLITIPAAGEMAEAIDEKDKNLLSLSQMVRRNKGKAFPRNNPIAERLAAKIASRTKR